MLCIVFFCKSEGFGCWWLSGNTFSLIIPAYNEEERLPIMLKSTLDYLSSNRNTLSELFSKIVGDSKREGLQYELIVVDDGSKDNTIGVVREYASKISGDTLKLVSMKKNSGKGAAVMMGMLRSSGQLCLMLDADGATDISDGLVKVLKDMDMLIQNHRDYDSLSTAAAVFGSRAHLEENSSATRSKVRTLLMHAFHFFVKQLCSARIKDTQCGFKLFTRPAAVKLFSNLHLRRW
jgi:dolichyl-phosphate beta-glucosyltransferase